MAEKGKPPETPAARRRKRATSTIDLKATDVTAAPATEASAGTPPSDRPVRNPQPEPEPVREPPEKPTPPAPPRDDPPPVEEPPVPPQEDPPAPIEEPPPMRGQAPDDAADHAAMPTHESRQSTRMGPIVAGGFVGAALVALLLAGLWLGDILPVRTAVSSDTSAQIASLESRILELQNRPAATPAVDPEAIEALRRRLSEIESANARPAQADPAVTQRLTAADNSVKSLETALAALGRRNDEIEANARQARERADAAQKAVSELNAGMRVVAKEASNAVEPAALAAVQQRIAALEQALKSAQDEIAQTAANARTARLAFAATALRAAAVSGAPYDGALTQAKSLGVDEKLLTPLAPFAQSGVPGREALAQELRDLVPALLQAAGEQPAPSGGFLDRLQANAGKLVRVRPLDAPSGDGVPDILARIEVAAAKADIDAALADLAKLPAAVRQPAEAWIAKATQRQQALAAARQLAGGGTVSKP